MDVNFGVVAMEDFEKDLWLLFELETFLDILMVFPYTLLILHVFRSAGKLRNHSQSTQLSATGVGCSSLLSSEEVPPQIISCHNISRKTTLE